MNARYPFSEGDLLEHSHAYFYTPYLGSEFLVAWSKSRAEALDKLPAPSSASKSGGLMEPRWDGELQTVTVLAYLCRVLRQEQKELTIRPRRVLVGLIQSFEVSKRIYSYYSPNMRRSSSADWHDLSLYVHFAEAVELAYIAGFGLPCLNALLKCVDILVALRTQLTNSDGSRVAALILKERDHVFRLGARFGLKPL